MKLAVMQPYIFPYLGYFQLIKAVDLFVFFDDVQFKRRSYITRNSILINDKSNTFSIPTKKGKRENLINEIELHSEMYGSWRDKFLKSLKHSYAKAPYFHSVFDLVQAVFEADLVDIAALTKFSIERTCGYLNIQTAFRNSSELAYDRRGDGQDKILSICDLLKANTYINAINGRELYTAEAFQKKDIELLFLQPAVQPYQQFSSTFTSHLSIIDIMMFLSPEEIKAHLEKYKFVTQ